MGGGRSRTQLTRLTVVWIMVVVGVGVGAVAEAPALSAEGDLQQLRIHPDLPDGSNFGSAVGVGRNTVVFGAEAWDGAGQAGLAQVYELDGDEWVLTAELVASDTTPRDRFGTSVDVASDGQTIVVGSDLDAAYVLSGSQEPGTRLRP